MLPSLRENATERSQVRTASTEELIIGARLLPAQASNGCRALHTAILLMRKVPAEDQPKLLAVALIELCASWLAGFTVYIMILPRCSG